jgi:hypothetical protein
VPKDNIVLIELKELKYKNISLPQLFEIGVSGEPPTSPHLKHAHTALHRNKSMEDDSS